MTRWLAVVVGLSLVTAAGAYQSYSRTAQGTADECGPSFDTLDPDGPAHVFTMIYTDAQGRSRTWTRGYPVAVRCREAQAVAAGLKQALGLDALLVTTCH